MKRIGHDGQFRHRSRQRENAEETGRAENSQPIERVIPEIAIARQLLEWLEASSGFLRRIFLFERLLEFLDQIPETNRVLLIARMMPMRRLEKGKSRRFASGQKSGEVFVI